MYKSLEKHKFTQIAQKATKKGQHINILP